MIQMAIMRNAPLKFRIMELVMTDGPIWTQDIVKIVGEEYNMTSAYQRNMINYDVIECVSAGFLKEGESVVDEEGVFRQGALLTCYSITPLGTSTVEELRTKVNHYE